MKYTYDIYQFDPSGRYIESVFRDLDPEAFEKQSKFGRDSIALFHKVWSYRSPAKRFIEYFFGPGMNHPYMQPNALRYVFCAINRTRAGKKIFLELPKDFVLAVQVYQVLLVLQVQECIGPLHGHIERIIRERPLSGVELETLWHSMSHLYPQLYAFAISIQRERETRNYHVRLRCGHEQYVGEVEDTTSDEGAHQTSSEEDTWATSREDTNMGTDEIEDFITSKNIDAEEEGYSADDGHPIKKIRHRRHSEPAPYITHESREYKDEEDLEY